MTSSTRNLIAASFITLLISGCASQSPTFGGSIQAEGKGVAAIGKKWDKGQELVKKGNKQIRKGNSQLEDGNENIAEGRAMVTSGERLIAESEAEYKRLKN